MIKLVTDMAADIPKSVAEELDIKVLPFMIHIDGKQILADINLSPEEFYDIVESSEEIPTTSQMSPADVEELYRSVGKENTIIHITISSKGSGINNTCNLVANQLNEEGFDITVIDSTMFAYVIGKVVVEAAKMAKNGASKQEIIDFAEESFERDTAYFLVDDLTFLRKGGRIKATAMVISKVLDIKPILNINDGLVEAFKKVRGTKKALNTLVDYIEERMDNPSENEVIILDSNAPDKVEIVEQLLRERVKPKDIKYAKIGPIITSHAGTGLVGVFFKHKKSYTEYENK